MNPKPETRNPKRPFIITIDGPAGVGKSTVAKLLAKRLGLTYLDTGATYRALAYAAVKTDLNLITDVKELTGLARELPLRLRPASKGGLRVLLDTVDVTNEIRTEEVSEAAAQVSQHPDVRAAMVALQRRLANRHGIVVEGRDTGSVVFPRATHKFFLNADPAIRARRRQRELLQLYGARSPIVQVQEQLHLRDRLDRTRRVGPLVKPTGAVEVDTSHLTAAEVVRVMLRHIHKTVRSP
ncbi:MAG: (d)CMP kinase [Candidatus Omnitrophica bacterium]|nr:(d)CMP kinase [Candidatus Omnitrophota bacterium]